MTDELLSNLHDARARTLALVDDLADEQLVVQYSENVNPFLWELGHVAFFYDAFVRQFAWGESLLMDDAARCYDSFKVGHQDRWVLSLPDRGATLAYMDRVLDAVAARVADADERGRYCLELATLHEDMHGEAFTYMRQYLGYAEPGFAPPAQSGAGPWPGDVTVPGGRFQLGASEDEASFVFDNEKWGHEVEVPAFEIAKAPVTNAEFAAFVEADGYGTEALWSPTGWTWRCRREATQPANWMRGDEGWLVSRFDRTAPLAPHQPVAHVSYFEAEAYCNWAGRRLPTEAEWERAASYDPAGGKRRLPWGDAPCDATRANVDSAVCGFVDVADLPDGDSALGCRQMLGNVWEWTSSAFYPFPGYVVDMPYREYSAPWFGSRMVLRGGAFATRSRMIHNTYRNFFTPDRRDVFAGFRTCARVGSTP